VKSRLPNKNENLAPQPLDASGDAPKLQRASDPTGDASTNPTPESPQPTKKQPTKKPTSVSPPTSARPGGQRAVGVALVIGIVTLGYFIWHSCFSLQAFGVVTGRVVSLSPAWPGTVTAIYVREGTQVRQGDLLISLQSFQLDSEAARLQDELIAARAALESQVAQLMLASQDQSNRSRSAWANFYLLEGDYQAARSKLEELSDRLARYQPLADKDRIAAQDVVSIGLEVQGQRALVDRYAKALEARRKLADASEQADSLDPQLQPYLARIQVLLRQLERLRDQLALGTLVAPCDGRVLDVHALVSEYAQAGGPLVEIVQDGTTALIVHARQRDSDLFGPGQLAEVSITPHAENIRCVVERVDHQFGAPAKQVRTRFREQEQTLSVYLTPLEDAVAAALPLGAEVRLVSVSTLPGNEPVDQAQPTAINAGTDLLSKHSIHASELTHE